MKWAILVTAALASAVLIYVFRGDLGDIALAAVAAMDGVVDGVME